MKIVQLTIVVDDEHAMKLVNFLGKIDRWVNCNPGVIIQNHTIDIFDKGKVDIAYNAGMACKGTAEEAEQRVKALGYFEETKEYEMFWSGYYRRQDLELMA